MAISSSSRLRPGEIFARLPNQDAIRDELNDLEVRRRALKFLLRGVRAADLKRRDYRAAKKMKGGARS
jgi:hypothetical protein